MVDETVFKSFDALKVTGSIAKSGTFIDRNGTKLDITDEMIESMYSNFKHSIPLKVSHDDSDKGGYLYKFALNPNTNNIDYEGIMFDNDRISKVKKDGFNSMSPEVTIFQDDNGNFVDARITAGAMTRRPAMKGMESTIMNLEFSAPEGEPSGIPDVKVTNQVQNVEVIDTVEDKTKVKDLDDTSNASENNVDLDSLEGFKKATTDKINAYKQTIDELTGKVTALENKNTEFVNKQIVGALKELKDLGIENPDAIGKGLDGSAKLQIYNDLKVQLAKSTSMKPPDVDIKINNPNKTAEESRIERARKLGYEKEYNKANNR